MNAQLNEYKTEQSVLLPAEILEKSRRFFFLSQGRPSITT
jgi:hypothetical protein